MITQTRAPGRSPNPPLLAAHRIELSVPREVRLRVSDEDFAALCRANPDLRLERTAEGDVSIMAPAGSESGGRNAVLTGRLFVWAEANGRGVSFDSSAGFALPGGGTRSPDASWIRKERWEALTPSERRGFAPICPDFAVELCSPSDDPGALAAKMQEYIASGLRLGWVIDPDRGQVEIHRPSRPVEVLDRPATLSGEDVLPGFTLDLKGVLFD